MGVRVRFLEIFMGWSNELNFIRWNLIGLVI